MGKHNPNGRYDEAEAAKIRTVSGGHFDEAASVFLARELQYMRARALDVKKAPLNAFTVFPVETEVPAGADSAKQRVYDTVGMADIISNYADDLRRVDVVGKEISVNVVSLGDAYGYNVIEIKHAQFAGINLDRYRVQAARRGIDQKINSLAWKGDSAHGITGFLNHPNITDVTLPADGNSNGGTNSTRFIHKTPAQAIASMNALIAAIGQATNQVEEPDTVLLPTAAYDYLATTARSDNSDLTVLDFLRRTHPEIRRWIKVGELNGAASDGTDMVVAGKFMPEYVRLEIPSRFEQMPVEKRNLEYVVDCIARAIGVTVTLPTAFAKAKGA